MVLKPEAHRMTPVGSAVILGIATNLGVHMTNRERLFEEFKPQFSDYQALEFIQKYGEIVSVDGREAALDLFLVMFASEHLTCGPISLNPVVARALCALLLEAGYGPQ